MLHCALHKWTSHPTLIQNMIWLKGIYELNHHKTGRYKLLPEEGSKRGQSLVRNSWSAPKIRTQTRSVFPFSSIALSIDPPIPGTRRTGSRSGFATFSSCFLEARINSSIDRISSSRTAINGWNCEFFKCNYNFVRIRVPWKGKREKRRKTKEEIWHYTTIPARRKIDNERG